jgi:hypothetical protein
MIFVRKQNKFYLYKWAIFILPLVSIISFVSQVQASVNSTTYSLKFANNGTISLNAKGIPLGSLLSQIQKKTLFELHDYNVDLDQPVYLSFESLSLEDAIRRILLGINYSCIFDADNNIKEIFIVAKGEKRAEKYLHKNDYRNAFLNDAGVARTHNPENLEATGEAMNQIAQPFGIVEPLGNVFTPPTEAMVDAMKAEGFTVPPEILNNMLPPEVENTGGSKFPPQAEEMGDAMKPVGFAALTEFSPSEEVFFKFSKPSEGVNYNIMNSNDIEFLSNFITIDK